VRGSGDSLRTLWPFPPKITLGSVRVSCLGSRIPPPGRKAPTIVGFPGLRRPHPIVRHVWRSGDPCTFPLFGFGFSSLQGGVHGCSPAGQPTFFSGSVRGGDVLHFFHFPLFLLQGGATVSWFVFCVSCVLAKKNLRVFLAEESGDFLFDRVKFSLCPDSFLDTPPPFNSVARVPSDSLCLFVKAHGPLCSWRAFLDEFSCLETRLLLCV